MIIEILKTALPEGRRSLCFNQQQDLEDYIPMVHKMYIRMFRVALAGTVISILPFYIYYLFSGDLESFLVYSIIILVTGLISAGIGLYFANITKQHDPGLSGLDYSSIDHIIIKQDIWYFKRLMMFDERGQYIGRATMNIKTIKHFFMSFLSHFSIIVPIDYHLRDHRENLITIFKRRGFRSAIVDIFDEKRKPIGRVEFDELKIIIKFKGTVFTGDRSYPVATEFLFEDADVRGLLHLSSFSNAIAYHDIFRSMNNEVAKLEEPISTETGKVALTLMAILYYVRWNSN